MNVLANAPQIIQDLAASVGVDQLLKWREEDDHYVIIASDGRKFVFKKIDPSQRRGDANGSPISAVVKEHVGEDVAKTTHRRKNS